ncbi:hypothetical protein FSARC_3892 [Fusarium sarcochroum]|uniref:BTB domain-containing protein n=1 Tax=Fusarium sarcochroum TaxID=1208366 RepID=A0A8H4XB79_9HYPO|nr:hypothetical protein FSARC_3892 [Fusarium sarcochroum]
MSEPGEEGSSSGSGTESLLEIIIPEGNIILVVGPQELRVQVSSHLLCLASPVFDAMLNSNFAEGTKLRESGGEPVEIVLPEDNGRAVLHALKTLYGADPAMLQLKPKEIQELAFMADKYDMASRFALAGTAWTSFVPKNAEDCWNLMTAAYWLGLHTGFHNLSRVFISKMEHNDVFRLANETPDETLGLKLGILLLRRAEVQNLPRPVGGLCLNCFCKAKDDALGMEPDCPFQENHYVE